jgi:hypothetical protein
MKSTSSFIFFFVLCISAWAQPKTNTDTAPQNLDTLKPIKSIFKPRKQPKALQVSTNNHSPDDAPDGGSIRQRIQPPITLQIADAPCTPLDIDAHTKIINNLIASLKAHQIHADLYTAPSRMNHYFEGIEVKEILSKILHHLYAMAKAQGRSGIQTLIPLLIDKNFEISFINAPFPAKPYLLELLWLWGCDPALPAQDALILNQLLHQININSIKTCMTNVHNQAITSRWRQAVMNDMGFYVQAYLAVHNNVPDSAAARQCIILNNILRLTYPNFPEPTLASPSNNIESHKRQILIFLNEFKNWQCQENENLSIGFSLYTAEWKILFLSIIKTLNEIIKICKSLEFNTSEINKNLFLSHASPIRNPVKSFKTLKSSFLEVLWLLGCQPGLTEEHKQLLKIVLQSLEWEYLNKNVISSISKKSKLRKNIKQDMIFYINRNPLCILTQNTGINFTNQEIYQETLQTPSGAWATMANITQILLDGDEPIDSLIPPVPPSFDDHDNPLPPLFDGLYPLTF